MTTVDVTVMGAGIFGLSVAYACQSRGARVRVIDPGGVGAGASGGIVGALAPHVPEQWNPKKQFQLESLLMAEGFWTEVERLSGLPSGYARSGRLQPLPDAAAVDLAQSRAAGAAALWGDAAEWSVIAAKGAAWEPPTASGQLIFDTLSGFIHPRQAVTALAGALAAKGCAVERDGDAEGAVVWATGWQGLVEMTGQHRRQVGNGVKGQAALFDYDAGDAPQVFAETLHFIPHRDGTVAVGSTTEREFDAPDQTDDQLEALIEKARQVMPVLADAPVIGRWAGVRPRSRSRAPMLGRHPFRDGAYVANGGFKIGFGMAPKVGEVMADLVLDGLQSYPDDFDVARSL